MHRSCKIYILRCIYNVCSRTAWTEKAAVPYLSWESLWALPIIYIFWLRKWIVSATVSFGPQSRPTNTVGILIMGSTAMFRDFDYRKGCHVSWFWLWEGYYIPGSCLALGKAAMFREADYGKGCHFPEFWHWEGLPCFVILAIARVTIF